MYHIEDKDIQSIADKLAELKQALNTCSDNLTLEEYDWLYGKIEDIQYLLVDIEIGGKQ